MLWLGKLAIFFTLVALAQAGYRNRDNYNKKKQAKRYNKQKEWWKNGGDSRDYRKSGRGYRQYNDNYFYKYNQRYQGIDQSTAVQEQQNSMAKTQMKAQPNKLQLKPKEKAQNDKKNIKGKKKTQNSAKMKKQPKVKNDQKSKKPPKNKKQIKAEQIKMKQMQQIQKEIQQLLDIKPQAAKIQPIQSDPPTQQPLQPTEIQIIQQIQKLNCDEPPVYDYNLLVLTWVPQNCYLDKDCEKDWQTYEDLKSPTIHGYRPFGSSPYYQSCFGTKTDVNCDTDAFMKDFDINQALWNSTGLLYDISVYWPANKFTHDEQDFYYQQWVNHGTCYLMNMIEDNPNAYKYDRNAFNRTIMVEYFKTAIKKYLSLSIEVEPGKQYQSKEQFAEDIGFRGKQAHFVLNCDRNNEIMEITFCYNRSKLPGKEVTIPCTLLDNCDEDRPLIIKSPL